VTPVVITVFDSETGSTTDYSFSSSPVRIGRNPLNDLTLPFPFVSGWHAVVRFDETGAKFFDLGSTNGTLLNGRRVQAGEPVPCVDEVSLTIGKLELRVRQQQPGAAAIPSVGQPPLLPGAHQQSGGTHVPDRGSTEYAQPATPGPARPSGGFAPTGPFGAVGTPPPGTATGPLRSAPPAHGTAHVEMADVHQTVHQLRPHYDAYRQAFAALLGQLTASVGTMPPQAHGFALSILQREFPALSGEQEFASFAREAGAPIEGPKTTVGGGGGDAAAVRRLAQSLRPDEPPPRSGQEIDRFLSCVEDVLRASAKAFVELQKGQEQFGKEMGVRTIKEYTALHAAGTPENVLKYLLDWQVGGSHRTQELVGVYADLMIHQVALINGIMEGVRGLLARLAPQEIERGVTSGWPTRAAATWKRYIERHKEIAGEDKNITSVVFGPEFARAYAEVGGEGTGGR
jgi:type VI secretion system protein